jgi:hypothetical protein
MEILTKTVLSLLCLVDIGGIVDHQSLSSDGQQLHQYQQRKRNFKQ